MKRNALPELFPTSNPLLEELRAEMQAKQKMLADHPRNVQAREKNKKVLEDIKESEEVPENIPEGIEEIPEKLIADLVSFVITGKGPSPLLDSSLKKDPFLYSRMAQCIYDHKMLGIPCWPLQHALQNPALDLDHIQYLLENGADKKHNEKTNEAQNLFDAMPPFWDANIFQLLLNAGYIFPKSNMKRIYEDINISLSKIITLEEKVHRNDEWRRILFMSISVEQGRLEFLQYACQEEKFSAEILKKKTFTSLMRIAANNGQLELLKYSLDHFKKNSERILSQSELHDAFVLSPRISYGSLQIIHYLLSSCRPLVTSNLIKKIKTRTESNVIKYLSCCNLEGKLDLTKSQQLRELEQTELKTISAEYNVEKIKDMSRKKDNVIINQWMHLALTLGTEEKTISSTDPLPRLTAINQLLPLNPFAVAYAWSRLKDSEKYEEAFEKVLVNLAEYYKHYIGATSDITDMSVHDDFIDALENDDDDPKLCVTKAALRAIEARITLAAILPADLFLLVAEYLAVQSPLVTPGLYSMMFAVYHPEQRRESSKVSLSNSEFSIYSDTQPMAESLKDKVSTSSFKY